jgi:hypothetical protein
MPTHGVGLTQRENFHVFLVMKEVGLLRVLEKELLLLNQVRVYSAHSPVFIRVQGRREEGGGGLNPI